jgi:hypothetical protein
MGKRDTTPRGNPSFVHNVTNITIIANNIECCVLKAKFAKKNVAKAKINAKNIFFNLFLSYSILYFHFSHTRLKSA